MKEGYLLICKVVKIGMTLGSEYEWKMFRKGIRGPRRDEVTSDQSKLHNKEFYDLCSSKKYH
jgi:hypothetical protein